MFSTRNASKKFANKPFKLFVCLAFSAVLVLFPMKSYACMGYVPHVSEDDILHPPADMLAGRALIMKVTTNGPLEPMPHADISVDLKMTSITQGQAPADVITVEYGPCHSLPGREGDTIAFLAIKDADGHFYAPQYWTKGPALK